MAALGWAACGAASADSINIGYISYDEGTNAPNVATFDIVNLTGPNETAFGDPADFPVTSSVNLSSLSLTVTFADLTTQVFGSSDFTLGPDGLSFDGPGVAFGGGNDAISAALTGTFSPTSLTLADGTTPTIEDTFSAMITDAGGGALQDGDLAIITATTSGSSGPPAVPEPAPLALMGFGLLAAALMRGRKPLARVRGLLSALGIGGLLLAVGSMLPAGAASAADVTLSPITAPSSGLSGVSNVNLTSAGVPAGSIASSMEVNLAPTCGVGATVSGEVTGTATSITTIIGAAKRINFKVPGGLTKGTYFVWVNGPGYASTNCAVLAVTTSNTTLNACVPSSSLAVAFGSNVTAYVPNGDWGGGRTGVQVVTLEGSGAPVTVPTPSAVNACAANPSTGETICTANTTDVYRITGSTLTSTLTSSANRFASFSGGSCENCGVALNSLTNTAYISGGFNVGGSGDGVQGLNLNTGTFLTPFATAFGVSENISIDPTRNLILNPIENNVYDLLQLNTAGGITAELARTGASSVGGEFDSAAEDCTTGIALSSQEFTSDIYLADLTQMTTTAGTPASWTAPAQSVFVGGDAGGGFSAGTSGISVAPGSGHLGVVTGEFGGNTVSVFQLPATSGSGTPGLVDYAYFSLPNAPDGTIFSAGFDPHTTTAYTSPNNGKAYGVIADWGDPSTTSATGFLAVIDLQALLAAPRASGQPHTVDPTVDLVATGVVRYVATH